MKLRTSRSRSRSAFALFDYLEPRLLMAATPSGLMATAVRAAYGFNQLSYTGTGQTIAIVDAYDDQTIASDLNVFDAANGIAGDSSTFFTKYKISSTVKADGGWAQEISLDVEWAHAIAPGAKILLVEAKSDSMTDLLAAVDYARNAAGVSVVSMSWGGSDSSSDASFDSHFTTPAGHIGVTFVASAGDTGGVPIYPATSPNVIAVGGTTLHLVNGAYGSETAWSDSGGGASRYESAPAYETAVTGSTSRSTPDVAYDADPSTGFAVYDSTKYEGLQNWMTFGGTSCGAPQWAALIALADQARGTALDGASQTLPTLYAAPASDFHDVTTGSTSRKISAGTGYDLATGRGSPVANLLVPYLATSTVTVAVKTTQVSQPQAPHRGFNRRRDELGGEVQELQTLATPEVATATEAFTLLAATSPLPTIHEPAHAAAAIIVQQGQTRAVKQEKKDEENWSASVL